MKVGFLGFDLKEHKATIFNDGNQPFSTTTLATISEAVANAMLIPEKTANKYLFIDSFTVTQNQVLASLEKANGVKWEIKHMDAELEKKNGQEKLSKGDFSGAMDLIRYINFVDGFGCDYMKHAEGANKLLSLPKQTLDEVVAETVQE